MKKFMVFAAILFLASCTGKKEVKQYTIDQFYKNVSIRFSDFSPDETKGLVTSNETGIYNLFEIDFADGTRKQVTFSDTESLFGIGYVHGTGQILYSSDKGGNENDHIYLLNEDGTSTDLTPGEAVKASFSGFSLDKKVIYLLSNKRDARFFDLYRMNVGEWKEEMVWENSMGLEYAGASRDRSIIAMVQPITTSESQLFIHDLATGETKEVSEPGMPGMYLGFRLYE
ncbi:MAG: TolB family protein [Bacteroidales bacterium]